MNKILVNILFLLLFTALALPAIASGAPDFTLEDLDGDLFTLSDYIGEGPIVISFWATWCTPCKKELPHLQTLHDKYKDKGLTLITIAEDAPKTQPKVSPYVKSKKLTFPVLLDPDNEILHLFQGNTLPYRVVIDYEGDILETHQGYNPGDEVLLEKKINKLLNIESVDE